LRRNQFMIMTRFAGLMILAFAVYDFIWPVA
jgi:hypothetical protein